MRKAIWRVGGPLDVPADILFLGTSLNLAEVPEDFISQVLSAMDLEAFLTARGYLDYYKKGLVRSSSGAQLMMVGGAGSEVYMNPHVEHFSAGTALKSGFDIKTIYLAFFRYKYKVDLEKIFHIMKSDDDLLVKGLYYGADISMPILGRSVADFAELVENFAEKHPGTITVSVKSRDQIPEGANLGPYSEIFDEESDDRR